MDTKKLISLLFISSAILILITVASALGFHPTLDFTINQGDLCVVHGIKMNKIKIPIDYGMYHLDQEYSQVQQKLFPNARKVIHMGTCLQGKEREAWIWECAKCREAEVEWFKANSGESQSLLPRNH